MVFMTIFTAVGIAFLVVISTILNAFGAITGANISEITLPYNPEKGLVWEYDHKNDPYIKLKEMLIDGNEQVFKFVKCEYSDNEDYIYGCGYMMDLVFTDANGNTKIYYATTRNVSLGRIKIWEEDDVAVYEYTATAQKVYDDSAWGMDFSPGECSEYVVYDPDVKCNPKTFTVVYEEGMEEDDIIWIKFENRGSEGNYWESHRIQLDCSDGEAKLLQEDFWSTDMVR